MTTPAPSPCCPCPPPGTAAGFMLCDTQADGSVIQFVRIFMDNGSFLDRTITGAPYTPTGTVAECTGDQLDGCDTTTPISVANMCLADGTPIVVVVQRDCDGTVTAPGWVNLATGAYTAGLVPADAAPCDSSVTTAGSAGRVALCDLQPDGTMVGFLRAIAADGTITDTTIDGTPYTPTGTVGLCEAVTAGEASECASPTTPVATTGLCLADSTPIAVTVERDCDGVVVRTGWINLATGSWSAGAPPAGTRACGETSAFDVSGVLCDIDPATGDVLGLVLIEVERGTDGEISGIRLINAADGTVYTLQGTLSVCPAGVAQPERDLVILCDVAADGTVTGFVRDYARDENGAVVGYTDYTVAGAAYTPTGTVGVCTQLHCETLPLCDSSPVEVMTATVEVDAAPWRALHFPAPTSWPFNPLTPAPFQPLFDGGTVTVPPPAVSNAGGAHTWAAGRIDLAGCSCPDGMVEVTVAADFRNDGPGGQFGGGTGLYLYNGTTQIAVDGVPDGMAADTTETVAVAATVSVADLLAGQIVALFQVEGSQSSANVKTWTLLNYAVTAQSDCGRQFLRTVCRDDAGAVLSTGDTLDGTTPYTPLGAVTPCPTGPVCPETACQQCTELVLCDATGMPVTSTISGTTASATLPNGVTWSTEGSNTAWPPAETNADGAWWRIAGFPNPTVGPLTYTFDYPVDVTFSVALRYVAGVNQTHVQVPVGSEVVSLPAGYHYDAATGVVSGDETLTDCPTVTDPTKAASARFRLRDITSFTLEFLGVRAAVCGQFGNFALGGVDVVPAGDRFIRTICRDCEGAVVSVTDTTLDGTSPYTPLGEVSSCEPDTPEQRTPVCYTSDTFAETCAPGVLAVTPIDTDITSSSVAANPNGYAVAGLSNSHDGVISSTNATTISVTPATGAATGLVLRFDLAAPADIVSLNLWDNYGGDPTDQDGIGSATLTVYDAADNPLWQGPLNAGNGGAPFTTAFGQILEGAAYFTLSTIARIAGTTWNTIGWREIAAVGAYRAIITWECPDETITAAVEGVSAGVTFTDGNLTQTNGPHTFTFSSSLGEFELDLASSAPGGWSTLSVSDSAPETVLTGDTTSMLTVAAVHPMQVRAGWVSDTGVVTDANTGEVVADARIVPCADAAQGCDCAPESICIEQNPVQVVEFISNEAHLRDNSVDPVWEWTPTSNGLPLTDPDFGPSPTATWYDMYRPATIPTDRWSITDTDTERPAFWITNHPDATAAQAVPPLPGEGPGLLANSDWFGRASFDLPANADPASIQVQVTVLNADQYARSFRLNDGTWQTIPLVDDLGQQGGCFEAGPPENCEPYTFPAQTVDGAQAGTNTIYMRVHETVGGFAGVIAHLIITYQVSPPARRSWTRMRCCDGTSYYLDEAGGRHDTLPDGWMVVPCGGGGSTPVLLCDDNAPFLRHVTYLSDGSVSVSDTSIDGGDYTPVGTVGACAGTVGACATTTSTIALCDTVDGGAPPVTAVVDFAALAGPYPDAVALGNGVTVGVDQGVYLPVQPVPPGSLFLGPSGLDPQVWTFSQPSTVRFRVTPATITGNVCIQLPAGAVVENVQPGVTHNVGTNQLCQSGAITTDVGTTVRVDNTTGFQLAVVSGADAANNDWMFRAMEVTPVAAVGGTTTFLRNITSDCTGVVVATYDTTLDGQSAYMPVGTVGLCQAEAVVMAMVGDTVSTGFVNVPAGDTTARDLKADHPGIQSVTLTVLTGSVAVATDVGGGLVPAGVTQTWSVAAGDDSSLAAWSAQGQGADAAYLLAFTFKNSISG